MRNTSLCYIERGDEYLMLHRISKRIDENRDKWIGVGGKFEEGESPEDCVRREVLEETGLELEEQRYRAVVTFVSDEWGTEYMPLFTAPYTGGDIRDCDEGRLEWVKKVDITSLPIWQGDRIFLSLIAEDAPFFSLKLCYRGDELVRAVLDGKDIDFTNY